MRRSHHKKWKVEPFEREETWLYRMLTKAAPPERHFRAGRWDDHAQAIDRIFQYYVLGITSNIPIYGNWTFLPLRLHCRFVEEGMCQFHFRPRCRSIVTGRSHPRLHLDLPDQESPS